jgi:hypothetical protein
VGGAYGEFSAAGQWRKSLEVGWAAAIARLLGTFGKSLVGAIMLVVLLVGLIW